MLTDAPSSSSSASDSPDEEDLPLGPDPYWRDRLKGVQESPVLPYDLAVRATPAFHYAKVSRDIEARMETALLQLVRKTQASSVEDVWCAALAAVMHRYDSGSCRPVRIARSCPAPSGRPQCEDPIADLILGFIAETRIAEAKFTEETTFNDAVKMMKAPDRPQPLSVEVMGLLSKADLQALRPAMPVAFGAYRASRVTAAGCDLAFMLDPGKNLTLQYNTFRLTRGGANRILGHIFELLSAALTSPDKPILELPILTSNETESLASWNITGSDYPGDRCLHELFEAHAAQRPETTAIVRGGKDASFDALDQRAERMADELVRNGVGRGTLVATCATPGVDFIASLIAIWKCGAIAIPIDARLTPEHQSSILIDARPAVLICEKHAPHLRHDFLRLLELSLMGKVELPGEPSAAALPNRAPVTPDEVAWIVYPPDSSGADLRGVMGTHRALVNRLGWLWRDFPLERGEIGCSRSLAGSDNFFFEIFTPLLAGFPVVVLEGDDAKKGARFLEAIAESRITRVVSPPVILEDVVKEREAAGAEVPNLKLWIVSGGPLRIHTARRFQTLFSNSTLHFGFSSLETTGIATSYDIAELSTEAIAVPIGKPLANTKLRVVDSRDQDAPIGIPGEVWIGGDSLARGYLHHADLTAELFPSEAAEGGGEQRWFRTGNLGRFLPSGDVEIIGKFEDAIEIDGVRGHRAEIERILRSHPEVDRAAVRVMRTSGQTNLAAYITPALMTRPPRESDLRPFLNERLPLELVPESFTTIPSFPRSLTDQIDWNRMPEPRAAVSAAAATPGEPAKPRKAAAELEKEIAALWGELLGGIPASHDTDLFELGGTSQTVIALTLALSRHHQHRVSVQAVLDNPTIRKLAAYLQDHHDSEASWTPVVNVRLAGDGAPLFLIHDVGPGSLGAFNRLADELNPSRPVYGMMSRAISGFGEYSNVESLATAYIQHLRQVIPEGPVFLGGFYFGGRIAMEMARQMKAKEDEADVPLVVLLDSHPHGGGGLKRAFGRGAAPDPGPPADISHVFKLDPCAERYRKVLDGQLMIRDRFSDKTYDGKVALLVPQIDPILPAHSQDYGWWKFAEGDLDVVQVPCGGDLRKSPEAIAGQLGNLLHLHEPG